MELVLRLTVLCLVGALLAAQRRQLLPGTPQRPLQPLSVSLQRDAAEYVPTATGQVMKSLFPCSL